MGFCVSLCRAVFYIDKGDGLGNLSLGTFFNSFPTTNHATRENVAKEVCVGGDGMGGMEVELKVIPF